MTATRRFYLPTPSDVWASGWRPYREMHRERIRAHELHDGEPGGSMERRLFDDPHWLPVLVEEIGEVARELCEWRHGKIDRDGLAERLRAELVQVGAMTAAWIESIDLDRP